MDEFTFIRPMKASPSNVEFLQSVDSDERWAVGEKMDGYREQLHFGKERNEMFSSAGNSHIAKCPQFQIVIPELAGTVIDCEGLSPTRMLEDNAACFKADPYNAIEWQKTYGMARLVCFDVLCYEGKMVWQLPFNQRRNILDFIFFNKLLQVMPIQQEYLMFTSKVGYYKSIVARTASEGHEGVILKRMEAPYRPGYRGAEWLKVKREETLICHITGFLPGAGKFANMVGSIAFEETERGAKGYTSGMSDDVRLDMTQHWDLYLGKYCYIGCQEVTRKIGRAHV